MSANLAHPAATVPFTDAHDHEPSLGHDLRSWVMLGFIAVGDIVAFSVVLMRVFSESAAIVGIGLTLAASAASILLMHEAGTRGRAIRANISPHGWKPVVLLTLAWLSLGLTAFAVRIHVETSAPTAGFGSISAEAVSFTDALPSALLLLVIFLAGGIGAYVVGFRSFNPARSAVFRIKRRLWFATRVRHRRRRTVAQLMTRHDRLTTEAAGVNQGTDEQIALMRAQADDLKRQARIWVLQGALTNATAHRDQARAHAEALASSHSELDAQYRTIVDGADHAEQIALTRAQAAQLKELARLEIAKGTAEPAATTGLLSRTDESTSVNGHRPRATTHI
jgi:hypothetical protein